MRLFVFPLGISALTLIGALILEGPNVALTLFVLTIIEITLSFDNAVINALWLQRMSPFWQKMFLTVGIAIAVFGMRLVFPVVVVAIAAGISIIETVDLAINDSLRYTHILEGAHDSIATFGAVFLGMIFLSWITEERDIKWLGPIEGFMARIGKLDVVSAALMLAVIVLFAQGSLLAGVCGLLTFLVVNMIAKFFEEKNNSSGIVESVTKGGVGAFLYLELMDASFSFDGVMAAFAVTTSIMIIAIGLGNGAIYIRTMTVFLTNKGVLKNLVHLEHGAHWAIGLLALLMFASLHTKLPEALTAVLSLGAIGASLITSLRFNKKAAEIVS